MAQPGSALAWGARGRWFKSSYADQLEFCKNLSRRNLINLKITRLRNGAQSQLKV
jgi:hypothetical protein